MKIELSKILQPAFCEKEALVLLFDKVADQLSNTSKSFKVYHQNMTDLDRDFYLFLILEVLIVHFYISTLKENSIFVWDNLFPTRQVEYLSYFKNEIIKATLPEKLEINQNEYNSRVSHYLNI